MVEPGRPEMTMHAPFMLDNKAANTHTQNIEYVLRFLSYSGEGNMPQCYIVIILSVLVIPGYSC